MLILSLLWCLFLYLNFTEHVSGTILTQVVTQHLQTSIFLQTPNTSQCRKLSDVFRSPSVNSVEENHVVLFDLKPYQPYFIIKGIIFSFLFANLGEERQVSWVWTSCSRCWHCWFYLWWSCSQYASLPLKLSCYKSFNAKSSHSEPKQELAPGKTQHVPCALPRLATVPTRGPTLLSTPSQS